MIDAELLCRLRNDLPMLVVIAKLGRDEPPSKRSEGYFRFLCPHCGEMRATGNPCNNLAHCFCCQGNLNNIDLLILLDHDFRNAVALLERWLEEHEARQAKKQRYLACRPPDRPRRPCGRHRAQRAQSPLQNSAQFGNQPSDGGKIIRAQFGKKCDPNLDRHT